MAYSDILRCMGSSAKGVQSYDQSADALKSRLDIKSGVCRALVVLWLKAKRQGTDFWKSRGTAGEGLLDASRRLAASIDLQREYEQATGSRFVQDAATKHALDECGLTLTEKEITANAQWGFATKTLKLDQPGVIATHVKGGDACFFILSIAGASGAHSIGIYRDWKILGPDQIYVFDPNFGEFNIEGIDNTAALLRCIQSSGYHPLGIDLNQSYILWPYKS